MDRWKYFAIGHTDHAFCNPSSEAKLDELIGLLRIPSGGRVLDIACGKAELLIRTARRFSCRGVGVDLSPPFVSEARARVDAAGLGGAIEIVCAEGSRYDGDPGSFDVAACLGASWIWGGHTGTLDALAAWTKPGGMVLVGEPFWRRPPTPEYLKAAALEASGFATHAGNVAAGIERDLIPLHAIVSSEDDWDRYEGLQWHAAELYASENPEDPDVPDLLRTMHRHRDAYLHWGRDELGWSMYLFRKPATRGSVGLPG